MTRGPASVGYSIHNEHGFAHIGSVLPKHTFIGATVAQIRCLAVRREPRSQGCVIHAATRRESWALSVHKGGAMRKLPHFSPCTFRPSEWFPTLFHTFRFTRIVELHPATQIPSLPLRSPVMAPPEYPSLLWERQTALPGSCYTSAWAPLPTKKKQQRCQWEIVLFRRCLVLACGLRRVIKGWRYVIDELQEGNCVGALSAHPSSCL